MGRVMVVTAEEAEETEKAAEEAVEEAEEEHKLNQPGCRKHHHPTQYHRVARSSGPQYHLPKRGTVFTPTQGTCNVVVTAGLWGTDTANVATNVKM